MINSDDYVNGGGGGDWDIESVFVHSTDQGYIIYPKTRPDMAILQCNLMMKCFEILLSLLSWDRIVRMVITCPSIQETPGQFIPRCNIMSKLLGIGPLLEGHIYIDHTSNH